MVCSSSLQLLQKAGDLASNLAVAAISDDKGSLAGQTAVASSYISRSTRRTKTRWRSFHTSADSSRRTPRHSNSLAQKTDELRRRSESVPIELKRNGWPGRTRCCGI